MPNYLDYRKSISNELISIKDRLRHIIEDKHWGEEGRYKEIILSETLRNLLPQNVTVATGFVMVEGNIISTQIDIIIYRTDYPVLFKIADFVVVAKDSVIGIVEVKTKLGRDNIKEAIEKSHNNGKLIGNHIFNGIFGYETDFRFRDDSVISTTISNAILSNSGYLNNICFGKDYFMKYWETGKPNMETGKECYRTYEIIDLSFGYFISNLIEDTYIQTNGKGISDILKANLYPIEETKEAHRLENLEIVIQ